MSAATAVRFLQEATQHALFLFETIQTNHGPEFGKWFIGRANAVHRHTRPDRPNDNAHIERFNRSVQEECLDTLERTPEAFNKALKKYLRWHNEERQHFGLNLKIPLEFLKCFQGID